MSDINQPAVSSSGVIRPTPYQSDNGFKLSGVAMLVSSLVIAGGVLGWVAHWVQQYFWMIVIFPALIGMVLGAVGVRMCKQGHVRNPLIGGAAGLLGGLLAMFCMHHFDFEEFRSRMVEKVPVMAELIKLPEKDMEAVSAAANNPEKFREVLWAMRSFKGFMDFEARQGVEITNHGSMKTNLGYVGSYIYWGVEVLIVALVTLVMVREQCAKPYCCACEEWKKESPIGGLINSPEPAKAALITGDVQQLTACNPQKTLTNLNLFQSVCPTCQGKHSPIEIRLEKVIPQKKNQPTKNTLAHVSWPSAAVPALRAMFEPPPPAAP